MGARGGSKMVARPFEVHSSSGIFWICFSNHFQLGVGAGRSGAGIGLFLNPPHTLRVENFQPVTRAEGTASAWVRVLRGG